MSQETSTTGYGAGTAQSGNGPAIAGLVCGLVGLLVFAPILGPLAVIFGGIGWSKANRGAKHKGLAIAAVVLGIVDIVLWGVLLAVAANNGGSAFINIG